MMPSCHARIAIARSIGDTLINNSATNVIHGLKKRSPNKTRMNSEIMLKALETYDSILMSVDRAAFITAEFK